jgi:hypothetical protein
MIEKHIPSPKSGSSFGRLNDFISGKSKRRIEAGEKQAATDRIVRLGAKKLIPSNRMPGFRKFLHCGCGHSGMTPV